MTVSARPNTETLSEHRRQPTWNSIFRAMHALSDAGVGCEDAYQVLKVEVLAVSIDESGDVVVPDARRPRPGANQSGPICRLGGRDDPTQN